MQISKRRRLSPVLLVLFLCYAAFSQMSHAQFVINPGDTCGFVSCGPSGPSGPVTPLSAPSSSSTTYAVNTDIVLTIPLPASALFTTDPSLLERREVYESVNNQSYALVATPVGSLITRQVSVVGTVRYRYRACNADECSGYSPVLTLTITQAAGNPPSPTNPPPANSGSRRVVFLHTDALGSPAAETNEQGEKQ